MDVDLSQDQREIADAARRLLADRCPPERVRELARNGGYDDGVWSEVSVLGWPGLAVGEAYEGLGLGVIELAVVLEEAGRALAPLPLLGTTAAALAIEGAGSDAQRKRWLPGLAAGSLRGTVGVRGGDGRALTADARSADVIVLLDGTSGVLVEPGQGEVEPVETLDPTRSFGWVRAAGEPLDGDITAAADRIAVLVAAELTGVAQRALEMTVDYVGQREQFGQPVGAFQAVAHRCAQMLLDVEKARSLTYYAAWTADHEPESAPLAASMAASCAAEAGWRVTTSAVQAHGGIGFTWEHDLHFFLKRAKVDAQLFGTVRSHRDRLAALSGLGDA